ncbi:NAD-dependent succinate-semialdehyde dehydrogenase [Staphylococcus xylosus]|uniref:NAD-dependent succinate-semialdehyde dehydrogenase n=1 Tax=Staphylococcus xylosus TaxID=1288 RepID=UPI001F541B43|nr:NAD-dependent succinate-semialdehyde dehydrogenase [Staphylococcus xylosus]
MLYINGEWKSSENNLEVVNPATGEVIETVAKGEERQTDFAIDAAKNALPTWSKRTAKERSNYLNKVAEILRSRIDMIAEVITKEMGKPVKESKTEISLAIDYLEWYAEEGKRIYGETIPASSSSKRLSVIRQPIGIVGAITPWNFPIAMITRKVAPAMAAGCTVILKPASSTPLTAIEVIKAFHDAGIPEGVVNLIHGTASKITKALMRSSDVRKITFTGSTEVGKSLVRQSADTMKKLSLELGGHAPFIVFEDADLDKTAEDLLASKFRNAGQTCVCTNRVYVHENIVEKFSEIFAKKVRELVVGNGIDSGVTIGPLIDNNAVDKVESQVKDATERGAKILVGGNRLSNGEYSKGNFFEPTLLVNATHNMKISYEETFGPVAPIFSFTTEKEAVEYANSSEYGLASYIFTKDASRIIRVSEALDYGIVGINDPMPTVAQAPFGGVKESGFGREGGRQGIEDYLEYKYLSFQLDD